VNAGWTAVGLAITLLCLSAPFGSASRWEHAASLPIETVHGVPASDAVGNFSSALQRLVDLVGFSGSALLAIVWARVALSWFSNDVSKKVQAKDRARDALVGTLLFTAALTGLVWGLARWVLTGA
jgi:hypothetical protein